MNYSPKNNNDKLTRLEESTNGVEDVKAINFSKLIDLSIDESEDLILNVEKEVSKIIGGVVRSLDSLKKEILADIEIDFTEKLELYSFLVEKKIETDEVFPFSEWYNCANNKENNLMFDQKQILIKIGQIHDVNVDLGKSNLVEYLVARRDNIRNPEQQFQEIESFISTRFPKANILDVLSASSYTNVLNGLNGENVELNFLSKLYFQYAANLPSENWTFKKNKIGVFEIESSTSDFNEIFEEFSKTEIWNRISKYENLTKLFIKEIVTEDRSNNQFYKQVFLNSKYRLYQPVEVKWNVAKAFVEKILINDIKMTEFFVEKLIGELKTQTQKESFAYEAIQLVNIAVFSNLNQELNDSNQKEKNKHKI